MGTYFIQTIGCQMNERDSETIAGLLEQMGYTEDADQEKADVLVINTCSVRENADNRFFGLLGRLKHIKLKRPGVIVAVCGCMMQQGHIVEQIEAKHAWVDIIFGTHNLHAITELIDEVQQKREKEEIQRELGGKPPRQTPSTQILDERAGLADDLPVRREFPFKGSVNIMYGCNNFCTYCIVPYTRGREISRDAESIITEIRSLVSGGAKEILLLGQNVNSYAGPTRRGDAGKTDFADLITMVDRIPGVERIRFMTSHPKDLSDKLIDRFSSGGKDRSRHLCPSIHLPIQSGSTRILELMNRRYTKESYLKLVEKLRAARPDIVLSTDFIVGFPGEKEEDFEHTMDVIERIRFDTAFTFLYSPRSGTPAAGYSDPEPDENKQRRFDRMVRRLNEITLEKNREYIGTVQDVLVEGPSKTDPSMYCGRTFGNKLVNFPLITVGSVPGEVPLNGRHDPGKELDANGKASLPGSIVPVRITSVKTFSFTGELVGAGSGCNEYSSYQER